MSLSRDLDSDRRENILLSIVNMNNELCFALDVELYK